MGQKVNPNGLRLLVNNNWSSIWYDDRNYSNYLIKDLKIRKIILSKYPNSLISNIEIERTLNNVFVKIKTAKAGLLIGKKGADIDQIKKYVQIIDPQSNVDIKVADVEKADSDAQCIASSIAKQLEARSSFKRVMKRSIQNATKHINVKGIKISVSGRLNGAEIARTEKQSFGSVPLHTIKANIDYATETARTIYGAIGVKVWVYKKN